MGKLNRDGDGHQDAASGVAGFDEPFAVALRTAISNRQVSLTWLHRRLAEEAHPVSIATLSYWRSGQRQPEHASSLEALSVLEELLRLKPGELVSQLGPSRRAHPEQVVKFEELVGESGAMSAVLRKLDFDDDSELEDVSIHCTIDFNQDARIAAVTNRKVWRARRDGVYHAPAAVKMRRPGDLLPEVRSIAGCTIGRTTFDTATGIFVAELLLDRPLMTGETALAEYQVSGFVGNAVSRHWMYVARRKVRDVVVWVRFHPDRLPDRLERYAATEADEGPQPAHLSGAQAHYVERNFGPGKIGFRWAWNPDEPMPEVL
jgi:hypothetical protein